MLKYWVWLSELKGLRNQTRLALLRRFGDRLVHRAAAFHRLDKRHAHDTRDRIGTRKSLRRTANAAQHDRFAQIVRRASQHLDMLECHIKGKDCCLPAMAFLLTQHLF